MSDDDDKDHVAPNSHIMNKVDITGVTKIKVKYDDSDDEDDLWLWNTLKLIVLLIYE